MKKSPTYKHGDIIRKYHNNYSHPKAHIAIEYINMLAEKGFKNKKDKEYNEVCKAIGDYELYEEMPRKTFQKILDIKLKYNKRK